MKRCLVLSAALLFAAQAQVVAGDKTTAHDSLAPMREELMRKAAAQQNPQPEQVNNRSNAYNLTPTPVAATLPAQAAAVIHYNSNPQPAIQQPAPQAAPAVSRIPSQGQLVPANNNQVRGNDLSSYICRVILAEGLPWLAGQTGRGLSSLYNWYQTRQNPRPGNNN